MTTRATASPCWLRAVGASATALPLLLLGGCAGSGGVVGQVQEAVADVVLPPEQAAQLGRQMSQQIEAKQAVDPAGTRRVSAIGQRILSRSGAGRDTPYDYQFKVVRDDATVNAFALPGGYIYVTSGLLQRAGSDAELASVVAHEIAHVSERHVAERLATSYGLQALGAAALGADAGTVGSMVSSVLQQGFLLKYSRGQELEADRVGLRFMRQAGYDPQAAVAMFRKLGAGGGGDAPAFMSSHPTTERRIEQLQELIDKG